jgi:hypothetical protein
MWLGNALQSLKLFIVLNPMEWTVWLLLVSILIGTYLEHLIHWWD